MSMTLHVDIVSAEVEIEAGLLEPVIEFLVPLLCLVGLRFHHRGQHRIGQRGEDQVGLLGFDAGRELAGIVDV